jgi:hypothetical protein
MPYTFNYTNDDQQAFNIVVTEGSLEKAKVTITKHVLKGWYTRPWGDGTRTAYFNDESDLGEFKSRMSLTVVEFDELKSLIECGKQLTRSNLLVSRNRNSADVVYQYQQLLITVRLDLEVVNGGLRSVTVSGYMVSSEDVASQWGLRHDTRSGMERYHEKNNQHCLSGDVLNTGKSYMEGPTHPNDIASVFSYAGLGQLVIGEAVAIVNQELEQYGTFPIRHGQLDRVIMSGDVVIHCYANHGLLSINATRGHLSFDMSWEYDNNDSVWISGTFTPDIVAGATVLEKIKDVFMKVFDAELVPAAVVRLALFCDLEEDHVGDQGPVVALPTLPWIHNQSGIEFQVEGFIVSEGHLDGDPYAVAVGVGGIGNLINRTHGSDRDDDGHDDRYDRWQRAARRRRSGNHYKYYIAAYNIRGEVELTELDF